MFYYYHLVWRCSLELMRNAEGIHEANGETCVEFIVCLKVYQFIRSICAFFFCNSLQHDVHHIWHCVALCVEGPEGGDFFSGSGQFFCAFQKLKLFQQHFQSVKPLSLSILKLSVAFSSHHTKKCVFLGGAHLLKGSSLTCGLPTMNLSFA